MKKIAPQGAFFMQHIIYLCIGLALLMPNHYMPWLSFHADALVFFGFFIFYFTTTYKSKITIDTVILISISLIPILQYLTGKIWFEGDAAVAFIYLSGLAISYHIGINYDGSGNIIKNLSFTFFICGILSTFISIHQWLELDKLSVFILSSTPSDRYYGNLAQPNQLSTLLFISIVSAYYLKEKNHISTITYISSITLLTFGMVLTKSRTPFAQVIAIFLVFLLICKLDIKKKNIKLIAFPFISAACIYLSWNAINSALLLHNPTPAVRTDSSLRIELWTNALHAMKEGLWTGYGFNQIVVAQLQNVESAIMLPFIFESTHNILFDIIFYTGILIGIPFIIWFSKRLYFITINARSSEERYSIYVMFILLTHAMLEFPLNYAYFLLPFGLLWGTASKMHISLISSSWANNSLLMLAAFSVIIGCQILMQYFSLEEDWRSTQMRRFGFRIHENTITPTKSLNHFYQLLSYLNTPAKNISPDDAERLQKVALRFGYASILLKAAEYNKINGIDDKNIYLHMICKTNNEKICADAKNILSQ